MGLGLEFQRLLHARGGTVQMKIFHLANWSPLIHPGPSLSRSLFMESSQLYAATLIHYSIEPLTTGPDYDPLVKNDRKATFQALHTNEVDKAVKSHESNMVLEAWPPPISSSEKDLTRKERSTLVQLRSGYCRLLGSYKSRIKKDASLNVCADCGTTPYDVKHLFVFPAHPTTMIPSDLWSRPTDAVRELSYLEERDPD